MNPTHVAVPFCSTEMEVNDGGGRQGWSPSISGWLPSEHVVGLHFLDPPLPLGGVRWLF